MYIHSKHNDVSSAKSGITQLYNKDFQDCINAQYTIQISFNQIVFVVLLHAVKIKWNICLGVS
jgi:hypothetical protein